IPRLPPRLLRERAPLEADNSLTPRRHGTSLIHFFCLPAGRTGRRDVEEKRVPWEVFPRIGESSPGGAAPRGEVGCSMGGIVLASGLGDARWGVRGVMIWDRKGTLLACRCVLNASGREG